MAILETPWYAIQGFFSAGGQVLWAVFITTALMWTMIVERLWFFQRAHGANVHLAVDEWSQRTDRSSWYAKAIRRQLVSRVVVAARRNIRGIQVSMALLPLLGLLGTVTGMIQVFNVMSMAGSANPRLMAAGVSAATIPTMAGLVAALSGFWFTVYFRRRINAEERRVGDLLVDSK